VVLDGAWADEQLSGDLSVGVSLRDKAGDLLVSEKHSGLVAGVSTTAIQIGAAIGLAVLATVAATTTRNQAAGTATTDALSVGYTRAFQVGAVIIALAVPIALALLRLRPATDAPQAESDRGEEDSR
jgi:hypothetical protein